jgi:hypothetical protein
MTSVARFEFPLAKAEYLLTYKTASGVGGDKQNFWRNEMGFESAEAIRESILAEVSPQYYNLTDRMTLAICIVLMSELQDLQDYHGESALFGLFGLMKI